MGQLGGELSPLRKFDFIQCMQVLAKLSEDLAGLARIQSIVQKLGQWVFCIRVHHLELGAHLKDS